MKDWLKLTLIIASAVLALRAMARFHRGPSVGDEAPPLALTDLSGQTVDLAAFRGKVVALNFWAVWCPPCKQELPELAQVWKTHSGDCFQLLGVTEESGSRERIASTVQTFGIPYPVVIDGDGRAAVSYRVDAYPRTVLIDAQGKVQRVFRGALRREALEEALKPLLASAPESCRV